jgi:muconolactone delta-isomerase
MPPIPKLFDATSEWIKQWEASGKMEESFAYAGRPGGGGILDVETMDELDEIMTGFPLGPFNEITVIPMAEIHASLQRSKAMVSQMAEMPGMSSQMV